MLSLDTILTRLLVIAFHFPLSARPTSGPYKTTLSIMVRLIMNSLCLRRVALGALGLRGCERTELTCSRATKSWIGGGDKGIRRERMEDEGWTEKTRTVSDFAMGMYNMTGLFRGEILNWDLVDLGIWGHLCVSLQLFVLLAVKQCRRLAGLSNPGMEPCRGPARPNTDNTNANARAQLPVTGVMIY